MFETHLVDRQELTEREAEVLCLVCSAKSDKAIARCLAISIWTVVRHIDSIRKKLNVQQTELNARLALLRVAVSRGIIRLGCLVLISSSVLQFDDHLMAVRGRTRTSPVRVLARRFE